MEVHFSRTFKRNGNYLIIKIHNILHHVRNIKSNDDEILFYVMTYVGIVLVIIKNKVSAGLKTISTSIRSSLFIYRQKRRMLGTCYSRDINLLF